MARNEEKAMGLLNRWTAYKAELRLGNDSSKKPRLAKNCNDKDQAMTIRRELLKEISDKIEKIQNPGLGEGRLRELNDEINLAFRRKYNWEKRILELGGPTFSNEYGGKYQYFGAARNLKEVKDLLNPDTQAEEEVSNLKRSREEMLKKISYKYFETISSKEEDTIGLLEAEKSEEERLKKKNRTAGVSGETEVGDDTSDDYIVNEFENQLLETVEYATLPSLSDHQKSQLETGKSMEKILVAHKKKELMAKYLV